MKNNKKRFWIVFLASLIVSIGLAFLFPSNIGKDSSILALQLKEESSIIDQKIIAVSLTPKTVTKVFYKGELLAIVQDENCIDKAIKEMEDSYIGTKYEGMKLRIDDDIYTLTQNTFWVYEDKDFGVIQYLKNHDLLVTEATQINIINTDGEVKDTIYVKSIDDFTNALRKFALCFIDENTYIKLENDEIIPDLVSYGAQDKQIYIEETIKSVVRGATVEDIFYDEDTIFKYLCYGRDTKLEYYTVVDYDTIDGVASKTGLTAKQLVAINDTIDNRDQALTTGQQLVATYLNPPLTVVVEQQRIAKVVIYAGGAEYETTDDLPAGQMKKISDAKDGYNDVTYTDIYVNGVLTSYRTDKTVVVEEPQNAKYQIGKGSISFDTGELSFSLPCYNPELICAWGCYTNHTGTDFIDRYAPNGPVLACERGVVTINRYQSDMGNFVTINHGNGYEIDYLHMKYPGYPKVGETVVKGQIIGAIGTTGRSTCNHVHITMWVNNTRVNPCSPGLLPCENAYRGS